MCEQRSGPSRTDARKPAEKRPRRLIRVNAVTGGGTRTNTFPSREHHARARGTLGWVEASGFQGLVDLRERGERLLGGLAADAAGVTAGAARLAGGQQNQNADGAHGR